MKASFTRSVQYVPTWNGNHQLPKKEQFTATLKPLNMADLLMLMDALQGLGVQNPDDLKNTNVEKFKGLMEQAGTLIPKYIEVSNLEDESGPVTAETLVEFPYYLELAAELLTQLASISLPDKDEEKN